MQQQLPLGILGKTNGLNRILTLAFLPATDIPETLILEGHLNHTLTLVALQPISCRSCPVRHSHISTIKYGIHRIIGAQCKLALGVGITIIVVHGLGIVQIELAQSHHNPSMQGGCGIIR